MLTPTDELLEEAIRKQHSELPAEARRLISADSLVHFVKDNPALVEKVYIDLLPGMKQAVRSLTPWDKDELTKTLQTKVGILSLSDSPTDPLLWAHYAASHKGMAIEFDTRHPYFNRRRSDRDELYHLRKVVYADRSEAPRTFSRLSGPDVLLTKSRNWEYEAEWRMLVPLEDASKVITDAEEDIYLLDFPLAAISGVVIGARAHTGLIGRVKRVLTN